MNNLKTLLEIITASWRAAGHTGPLTGEYIAQFRAANPVYGTWALCIKFYSGSGVPIRGDVKLERAWKVWRAAGNVEVGEAFDEFVDSFVDEYEMEFYEVKAKAKAKGQAKKNK